MTAVLESAHLGRHRLARLAPVSLETLDAQAALQTRVDRKYLVPVDVFGQFLDEFDTRLQVLSIDGRHTFDYRSVYFDTADLASFHAHLQRRRRRFKVRTRTYLDSGSCRLEVKTKGGRAETVKKRMRYHADHACLLTGPGREFVQRALPGTDPALLTPSLQTRYARSTLLDAPSRARITCDSALTFHRGDEVSARMEGAVLVETKSAAGAGMADRWLWRHRIRPVSISKYCAGVAMLYPGARSNPWHRVLQRHFVWG